jgi:hypothetical protein
MYWVWGQGMVFEAEFFGYFDQFFGAGVHPIEDFLETDNVVVGQECFEGLYALVFVVVAVVGQGRGAHEEVVSQHSDLWSRFGHF